MTLQTFAESHNLTLAKVKKICKTVLGSIPETLTDEQTQALDTHLTASAQALLPSSESQPQSVLTTTINQVPEQTIDQVIEVVGVSVLKKNASLYRNLLEATLSKTLANTAEVLTKVEQTQASMVATTYERMSRNLAAVYQEMNVPIKVSAQELELTEDELEFLRMQLDNL